VKSTPPQAVNLPGPAGIGTAEANVRTLSMHIEALQTIDHQMRYKHP